jgi:hypothetical protein
VPKPVIAEAITGVETLKVVASKPDPGLPPSSESEKCPDKADLLAPDPDAIGWRALARGRASLAFHIARSQSTNDADAGFPAELAALIALAPACDGSGRIDNAIREQCSHLWQRLSKPSLNDPVFLPGFLAAVRVALLARGASADAVLYPAREALSGQKVLGAIASAATEIVTRDQLVTPAVLAGVVERARWEDELGAIKDRAAEWLRAQESAQLKFARATEVWHKWVLPSADIGAMVKVVVEDRRGERHLATDAIDRLSSGFDRMLMAMDRKLHGHTADRNPIEAKAKYGMRERVGQACALVHEWCALLDNPLGEIGPAGRWIGEMRRQALEYRTEAEQEIRLIERTNEDAGTVAITELAALAALLEPDSPLNPPSVEVDTLLNRDLLLVPEARLTADLSLMNGHALPLDALLQAVDTDWAKPCELRAARHDFVGARQSPLIGPVSSLRRS